MVCLSTAPASEGLPVVAAVAALSEGVTGGMALVAAMGSSHADVNAAAEAQRAAITCHAFDRGHFGRRHHDPCRVRRRVAAVAAGKTMVTKRELHSVVRSLQPGVLERALE